MMEDSTAWAWVRLLVVIVIIAATIVFFSHVDDLKDRAAYGEGRRAGWNAAHREATRDQLRDRQALDAARRECEEECEDSLARQRGVLVEQIEECQGELVVSRINERR
jgi:hypothetical protein